MLRLVSASRLKLSLQRHPLPLSFAVLEELCTSQSKSAPPPLPRDKCVALKTVPVCGVVDEICFFNARISTQQPKSAFDENYLIETSDNIMQKEINLLRKHLLDQKSNTTAVM